MSHRKSFAKWLDFLEANCGLLSDGTDVPYENTRSPILRTFISDKLTRELLVKYSGDGMPLDMTEFNRLKALLAIERPSIVPYISHKE